MSIGHPLFSVLLLFPLWEPEYIALNDSQQKQGRCYNLSWFCDTFPNLSI